MIGVPKDSNIKILLGNVNILVRLGCASVVLFDSFDPLRGETNMI